LWAFDSTEWVFARAFPFAPAKPFGATRQCPHTNRFRSWTRPSGSNPETEAGRQRALEPSAQRAQRGVVIVRVQRLTEIAAARDRDRLHREACDLRRARVARERRERNARFRDRVRDRARLAAGEEIRAALAHDQRDENQYRDRDDREQRADQPPKQRIWDEAELHCIFSTGTPIT
jgi:hypothetical protein